MRSIGCMSDISNDHMLGAEFLSGCHCSFVGGGEGGWSRVLRKKELLGDEIR